MASSCIKHAMRLAQQLSTAALQQQMQQKEPSTTPRTMIGELIDAELNPPTDGAPRSIIVQFLDGVDLSYVQGVHRSFRQGVMNRAGFYMPHSIAAVWRGLEEVVDELQGRGFEDSTGCTYSEVTNICHAIITKLAGRDDDDHRMQAMADVRTLVCALIQLKLHDEVHLQDLAIASDAVFAEHEAAILNHIRALGKLSGHNRQVDPPELNPMPNMVS